MTNSVSFGPTGALLAKSANVADGVQLQLSFFLPHITTLTARVCLFGRGRCALTNPDGGPIPAVEQVLEPVDEVAEAATILPLFHWIWRDTLQLWRMELVIPAHQLQALRYLSVYVEEASKPEESAWTLRPEPILLEAEKSEWSLGENSPPSLFLLMTRGDAAIRLNRLQQTHSALQSLRDAAADALFDIFFLLIGGKDVQLMTCELEDENDE